MPKNPNTEADETKKTAVKADQDSAKKDDAPKSAVVDKGEAKKDATGPANEGVLPGNATGAAGNPNEKLEEKPEFLAAVEKRALELQEEGAKKAQETEKDFKDTKSAKSASAKDVPVRAIEDHECNIGGVEYSFKKDEEYEIPNDVAVILQNSRKVLKK